MKSVKLLFCIILLIASVGQVTSDLYLASLPEITQKLQTTSTLAQLTLSLYMYGFALSQLFYGPVSDGVGRKKPLLLGLVLLLAGTVVCVLSHSIDALIVGRFFQGLGAACGIALSRSILRDSFSDEALAKFSSYLASANVAIMASSPLLGSYIQEFFGWRANFIFLIVYIILIMLLIFIKFEESSQHHHISNLSFGKLSNNFLQVVTSSSYWCFGVMIFVTYGSIMAWMTAGPILLQDRFLFTPVEFGWVAFLTGAMYAVGGIVNARLLNHFSSHSLLFVGFLVMLVAAILLSITAGTAKPYLFIILITALIASTSFVFANAYANAMTPFGKIAGIAGSLFGFAQIIGGAVSSTIVAHLHERSWLPLSILLCVLAAVGVVLAVQNRFRVLSFNKK